MTDSGGWSILLTPAYFTGLRHRQSFAFLLTLVNCDQYSIGQTFQYLVCRSLFTPTVTFYLQQGSREYMRKPGEKSQTRSSRSPRRAQMTKVGMTTITENTEQPNILAVDDDAEEKIRTTLTA
jgi:hypothetical protein